MMETNSRLEEMRETAIAYNQANFSLSVGAAGQTPVFGVTLRA